MSLSVSLTVSDEKFTLRCWSISKYKQKTKQTTLTCLAFCNWIPVQTDSCTYFLVQKICAKILSLRCWVLWEEQARKSLCHSLSQVVVTSNEHPTPLTLTRPMHSLRCQKKRQDMANSWDGESRKHLKLPSWQFKYRWPDSKMCKYPRELKVGHWKGKDTYFRFFC